MCMCVYVCVYVCVCMHILDALYQSDRKLEIVLLCPASHIVSTHHGVRAKHDGGLAPESLGSRKPTVLQRPVYMCVCVWHVCSQCEM